MSDKVKTSTRVMQVLACILALSVLTFGALSMVSGESQNKTQRKHSNDQDFF